jgi:hypothetical protein
MEERKRKKYLGKQIIRIDIGLSQSSHVGISRVAPVKLNKNSSAS